MKIETKKLIEDFVSNEPPSFKPNIEVSHREVKADICVMCGEQPPEVVIFNPNGDTFEKLSGYEEYWDVCKECSEFISWGMGKAMDMMVNMPMPSSHVRFRVGRQFRVRMPRRRYEILRAFDLRMKGKIDDEGLQFILADLGFTDKEIKRGSNDYMKLLFAYHKKKLNRSMRKNKRERLFFFQYHVAWWILFGYMVAVSWLFDSNELKNIAVIWLWSLVIADIISTWKAWKKCKKLDKKWKGMEKP